MKQAYISREETSALAKEMQEYSDKNSVSLVDLCGMADITRATFYRWKSGERASVAAADRAKKAIGYNRVVKLSHVGISANLSKLMKDRGITADTLSAMTGVGTDFVTRYRTGVSYPSIVWCVKAADALGVTPNELVGIEPTVKEVTKEVVKEVVKDITINGFALDILYKLDQMSEEKQDILKKLIEAL